MQTPVVLTRQRKDRILERLAADGRIVARTLAMEFGLSEDTIRRDLRELAGAGRLQRVHGGALPASPADADLLARTGIATSSKRSVGRAAAALIEPGQVVIIDGGTTALQLVAHLPLDRPLTVVTHSPSIAVALERHHAIRVVLLGGLLYRHSMVAVGAATIEAIAHIRADCYFMGVTGIDPQAGLSTGDLEEAHIKRALGRRSAETIVLASAEKLNVASNYVVMPLSEVSGVVVDSSAPRAFIESMRKATVEVHRADDARGMSSVSSFTGNRPR